MECTAADPDLCSFVGTSAAALPDSSSEAVLADLDFNASPEPVMRSSVMLSTSVNGIRSTIWGEPSLKKKTLVVVRTTLRCCHRLRVCACFKGVRRVAE